MKKSIKSLILLMLLVYNSSVSPDIGSDLANQRAINAAGSVGGVVGAILLVVIGVGIIYSKYSASRVPPSGQPRTGVRTSGLGIDDVAYRIAISIDTHAPRSEEEIKLRLQKILAASNVGDLDDAIRKFADGILLNSTERTTLFEVTQVVKGALSKIYGDAALKSGFGDLGIDQYKKLVKFAMEIQNNLKSSFTSEVVSKAVNDYMAEKLPDYVLEVRIADLIRGQDPSLSRKDIYSEISSPGFKGRNKALLDNLHAEIKGIFESGAVDPKKLDEFAESLKKDLNLDSVVKNIKANVARQQQSKALFEKLLGLKNLSTETVSTLQNDIGLLKTKLKDAATFISRETKKVYAESDGKLYEIDSKTKEPKVISEEDRPSDLERVPEENYPVVEEGPRFR